MTDEQRPIMDPAFLRGLTQRRLSRRDALRAAGVGAGALSLSAIMAACGVKGTQSTQVNTDVGSPAWWDKQTLHKHFVFANWPYYIDKAGKGKYPSIELFTQTTGIDVTYKVPILDNPGFYATISKVLPSGQPTGFDIIVLTNNSPVLGKVIHTNKWAIPLDQTIMQNNFYKNAAAPIKDPSWDPGNKYTMAWQSGLTAIGYDPAKTGREISSVQDLFDPKFAGHVGMFSDPQELGTLGLLAIGVDPATSTEADWHKAADKLKTQAPLVRKYFDQGYLDALENGDTWISQAWSGDIFQANKSGYPNLKMAVPNEGGMLWTDNMMIPLYAQNPKDAMTYMDFVYRPDEGGIIAEAITYITPVAAAQPYIKDTLHDPVASASPLIFPDAATAAKFKHYYIYKDQTELDTWNGIFEPITTG